MKKIIALFAIALGLSQPVHASKPDAVDLCVSLSNFAHKTAEMRDEGADERKLKRIIRQSKAPVAMKDAMAQMVEDIYFSDDLADDRPRDIAKKYLKSCMKN